MSKASVYFSVSNMTGKHDEKKLKKELDQFGGVIAVSTNAETGRIAVDYDTTGLKQDLLERKIRYLGYDITNTKLENHIM